jgi:hypothetical protein
VFEAELSLNPKMFHFRPKPADSNRSNQGFLRAILFLLSVSISLGWGMIRWTPATPLPPEMTVAQVGAVDWVSPEYQLGEQLYLENCSGCHIAVPPQVLPTQTWQQLLQDTQHYGVTVAELVDPPRLIIWNYLQRYSRPLLSDEEVVPYRVERSRYFRVLHPQIDFPQTVTLKGCVSCHPGVNQNNFRQLSPEWQ